MNSNITFIFIITAILFMVGFTIAVIWFFTFAQNKIIAAKLKQKELELIFQKELLTNAVTVQEEERDRIARELHDDIGSKLNIAMLNTQLIKLRHKDVDDEMTPLLQQLENALRNCADRARNISHELMPPMLQNFGFGHALEELQDSLSADSELKIAINYYQNVKINDKIKLLHIFRILQELLSNTIKYAKASSVDISFEKNDNEFITLTYKDNGIGFDKSAMKRGLGFNNIFTRSELLNGVMDYTSAPDLGFKLTLKFINHD